jgi:hypothetical protein
MESYIQNKSEVDDIAINRLKSIAWEIKNTQFLTNYYIILKVL